MGIFRRRPYPIVCQEAVELVTDYLEGVLEGPERASFEAHLAECPHCHEYLEQMRATIASLGRIEPESLAPEVRDELVALYRRWSAD
ncbi:MAG: anti-sigma factor family protein [Acidimicrobiia bacterium]